MIKDEQVQQEAATQEETSTVVQETATQEETPVAQEEVTTPEIQEEPATSEINTVPLILNSFNNNAEADVSVINSPEKNDATPEEQNLDVSSPDKKRPRID